MAQASVGIGHLTTQAHEFVKQHIEYDGSARPEYVYTVRADAVNGTPCSAVRYSYVGTTSRIEFMKEFSAAWNIAWDLF
jgi:hypothetical protein